MSKFRFHTHVAAVNFRIVPHDRESESGALRLGAEVGFKNLFGPLRWNSRAVVGDRHAHGAILRFRLHVDVPATIVDMMGLDPLPVQHGDSLRPYLEGRKIETPREHIFSEYLENEEAYIKTKEWKYIFCSGKRPRQDGYQTDNPTPGRYKRLYHLATDPGEFRDVSKTHPELTARFEGLMLGRFRATHPDREQEPPRLSTEEAIEFYLRPRDAKPLPRTEPGA